LVIRVKLNQGGNANTISRHNAAMGTSEKKIHIRRGEIPSFEEEQYLQLSSRLLAMATLQADHTLSAVCRKGRTIRGDRDYSILCGNCISSPLVIDDMDNKREKMLIFVFPDLSVRVPGRVSLACRILDITTLQVSHTLVTSHFEVYNSKDFPGKCGNGALTSSNDCIDKLSLRAASSLNQTQSQVWSSNRWGEPAWFSFAISCSTIQC
jgi:Velvet factor